MVFKFYRYNDADIVPNKLKGATLVKSIDIYAPQNITPMGCSIVTKESIEANLAEYTHKGIKYVCYCTFTGMGNNMYTYKLDVDCLATAWYANCFDRYNIVARSNLGNFKNDGALLRDTQRQVTTYTFDDITYNFSILMNVFTPSVYTTSDSGYKVSNKGIRTYLFTPAQWNTYYNWLKSTAKASPSLSDVANSIKSIYILDSQFVSSSLFTPNVVPRLYSVAADNALVEKVPEATIFTDANVGLPSVQTSSMIGKNRTVPIRTTLSSPITIDEDTITGNLSFNLRTGVNINIPMTNVPKHISSITAVGYDISIDYKTGDFITYPVINGETIYDNMALGNITEDIPFMYDSSIISSKQQVATTIQIIGTIAAAAIGTGITAGAVGAKLITSAARSALGAATQTGISGAAGAISQQIQSNAEGTTIKFTANGNPYNANAITSKLTFTWVPTINKLGYQNRFGKADYTSRNITQLTGPVQTINCIASMNNLNNNIINIATQLCDNGIYII